MTLLIEEQLASIMPYLEQVRWYDEDSGIWLLYAPTGPQGNLTALVERRVYNIKTSAATVIEYNGISIPLHEGWNEVVWETPERKPMWPWVVGISAFLAIIIVASREKRR